MSAEQMSAEQARAFYGADAAEWLARWDSGQIVWTVEMGGLGPGYEQCIQITTAEMLRHMLAEKYDASKWADKDAWAVDAVKIEEFGLKDPTIQQLRLSAAQWSGALSLAFNLYRDGPTEVMKHEAVRNRRIQASNNMVIRGA